ncbi:hypothetical protein [Methylobacterium dankookense]|uniref:Uncharacterized protein n=1 Tax=Methylobacterium dankookense TaxID=560405 RepID=A0A564G1Q9_9HYPH|nr:hypothetical protein [Methylobacterium dankookense]GJD58254.1 hypothetical protein IFDJLNFL_4171 [Methylobacterium dankookense]VUF14177.1 hypothetical protein MTDSW087_03893 [Methylobacterium dankookense]
MTGRLPQRDPRARTRLTNGKTLFLGEVDGRTEIGRRYGDLIADLMAERGGQAAMELHQIEAIRTYAGLAIQRDLLHSRIAAGERVDTEELGQIGDRMDRQARRMGPPLAPERKSLREHVAGRGGRP